MNTDDLISKYYSIIPHSELENIANLLFDQSISLIEKEKIHKKIKKNLGVLKSVFDQLVIERNKIALKHGFNNYFEFVLDWYGLDEKRFLKFTKSINAISERILKYSFSKKLPDTYWTIYNEPTLASTLKNDDYVLPKTVLDKLKIPKDILSKINFTNSKDRYFYTEFDFKDKSVSITFDKNSTSSISALALAHEIGHATTYIKLMNKDIDPDSKSTVWHEEMAINTELKFESFLPKETIMANKDRLLYHSVLALFEYYLYRDPDQDLSKLYAKVRSQIYQSKEKTNPFWLLNTFLIDRPCYSALYATLYSEIMK